MNKIGKRNAILLAFTMLTASCSTPVPVAALCPKPPPAPQVLLTSPSTEPSLIEDWRLLMEFYKAALQKSFGEAMKR